MIARIAFYKGDGDIIDKLIRWYTNSKYSHCELVLGDIWISSSQRTGKLVERKLNVVDGHWDYIDINISNHRLDLLKEIYLGRSYDYIGILFSQILPMNIEAPNRLFCSEWCAMVLDLDNPNKYSPGDLYKYLVATNSK